MEIKARNVNDAVESALWWMKTAGKREETRNGVVLASPEPVITTYANPQERVLFWPERDANPVFHLMECIWMLAGRNDVEFVKLFNKRMSEYSDNGYELNGAYGFRWRMHFGFDQLANIIHHLKETPNSRRAVLTMWDPQDLTYLDSKDVPCNTQAFFDCRGGRLNMTVINRSNDLIWGAYGANAVHFSFLQEFIAYALGRKVGEYRQVSNNLHTYEQHFPFVESPPRAMEYELYLTGCKVYPLMYDDQWGLFLDDCQQFCKHPFDAGFNYHHPFFKDVAHPMAMIYNARKFLDEDGLNWALRVEAEDWRIAAIDWIGRR